MSSLQKIFLIILCTSIIFVMFFVIGISFFPQHLDPLLFLVFLLCLSFISISVVFVIVSNYHILKRKLYLEVLQSIRTKTIKRDPKWVADAAGFIPFSMFLSLVLFGLFASTPILETIGSIPFVQLLDLPLETNEKLFQDTNNIKTLIIILIVAFAGPVTFFLMRHLHYRLSDETQARYPGSNMYVGLLYTAVIVLTYNVYFGVGDNLERTELELSIVRSSFTLLTIFTLIISFVVWLSDRLIFSRLNY